MDTPVSNAVLALKVGVGSGTAEMAHEKDAAMLLCECKDLTPRERAAAHLLAVVSSHRAITWHRETEPPHGCEQAPPLESWQTKALHEQTEKAVTEYAVHIPEREAAALLAASTPESAAPPVTVATPAEIEQRDIKSERGCRRLIRENWPEIRSLYGAKADGRQVLIVLTRNKGKNDELPDLKTVQNKLGELRKENLIP